MLYNINIYKGVDSLARRWTEEEITILENYWGTKSASFIAKQLNRSVTSIKRMVIRLHLGPWLESGDYITVNQLWKTLGLGKGNYYRQTSWVEKRGFPVKYKKYENRNTQVIYLEDFWKWAEQNQDIVNFAKLEPLALGVEPDWVDVKRNQDRLLALNVQSVNWTTYEDNKLVDMLKSYRYTTKQIATSLHRTEQAVSERIRKLGLKYRPLPENRHNVWSSEDTELLLTLLKTYSSYTLIANSLPGHSEKGIKSKVYNMFGTSRIIQVQRLITELENKNVL